MIPHSTSTYRYSLKAVRSWCSEGSLARSLARLVLALAQSRVLLCWDPLVSRFAFRVAALFVCLFVASQDRRLDSFRTEPWEFS